MALDEWKDQIMKDISERMASQDTEISNLREANSKFLTYYFAVTVMLQLLYAYDWCYTTSPHLGQEKENYNNLLGEFTNLKQSYAELQQKYENTVSLQKLLMLS